MNETWVLALALVMGLALGTMFFFGLWWTVRKAFSSPQPGLLFLGSLLARTFCAVGGLWLVLESSARGGEAQEFWALVACMCGFLAARTLVTKLLPAPVSWGRVPARTRIQ